MNISNSKEPCRNLGKELLSDGNVLISGGTKTGKTAIIKNVLLAIQCRTPEEIQFHLIDSKKKQLHMFSAIPHCKGYTDTINAEALAFLVKASKLIKKRIHFFYNYNSKECAFPCHYIIIDELSELLFSCNSEDAKDAIKYILSKGPSVGVFLICSTIKPFDELLPMELLDGFKSRIIFHGFDPIVNMYLTDKPGYRAPNKKGYYLYRKDNDLFYGSFFSTEKIYLPKINILGD